MKQYMKTYLIELCCSYTALSVIGAVTNIFLGKDTGNLNELVMFAFCAIVIFVLSMHKLFDSISPLAMIVIQYVTSLILCGILLLIVNVFDPITPKGWFELFRSFTIFYIIGGALYYYMIFKEAKEQEKLLREVQEKQNKKADNETDK